MGFAGKFGFLIASRAERELICSIAPGCGLEAVDLSLLTPAHGFSLPAFRSAGTFPAVVIIDETTSPHELLQTYLLAGEAMPLVVRISDPLPRGPQSGSEPGLESGPDDAAAGRLPVWLIPRPLRVDAVRMVLRQAVSTLALLTARHRSLVDEIVRIRSIFGSVTNGITIADAGIPDLPLTYVNAAFESMTGYSAAEACGRNCRYLQGSHADQPAVAIVRQAVREGRDARVVLRNYRKDGTLFWNELYMSPIRDPKGRLTHYVGIQRDVTVEVESAQRLQHLADHDALTGLANRTLLMLQLKQALARAQRGGSRVAVVFLDLNHFKQVNDVLGHDAGDKLLQVLAERLRNFVRAGETVARLGGDEFIVVLEDLSGELHPTDVMERLLSALREPVEIFGTPIDPSVSAGMAIFPIDGSDAETLIKIADMKMYVAKHDSRSGRQAGEEAAISDLVSRSNT